MFNCFVPCRTSSAVEFMTADPVTGVVNVVFNNGVSYKYTNVSRRAIVNLLINPNISLGFWVNANCLHTDRNVQSSLRYSYSS